MFYIIFVTLVCFFASTEALFKAVAVRSNRQSASGVLRNHVSLPQENSFRAQSYARMADSQHKSVENALRKVINQKVLHEMRKKPLKMRMIWKKS